MKRLVVQVRGGHCSGKSTAVFEYAEHAGVKERIIVEAGAERVKCTRGIDTAVIGWYSDETASKGGCDSAIKNKEVLKQVLKALMREPWVHTIVFEGVLYGKTLQLAQKIYELSKEMGFQYVPILLNPPYEEVITRLEKRNGGKTYNEKVIYDTYVGALRAAKKMKALGIETSVIDSSKFAEGDMWKIVSRAIERARKE